MSNYPDDIHNYDSDPRSPFFVEPECVCQKCQLAFEDIEMANDEICKECWIKEDNE